MLSAHQPCYLPWLGFFDKLRLSDVFVLLDDVQFSSGSDNFVNRVKVKSQGGARWLTVPVNAHLGESIAEVHTVPGWRRRHIDALTDYYAGAEYLDLVDHLLPPESEHLADVAGMSTLRLIEEIMPEYIPRIEMQSELGVTGHKTELIVNLCKHFGEHRFLFGSHGRDYADLDLLRDNGIEPVFQEYQHPTYPQFHGAFVAGLSVVDVILNIGIEKTRRLLCL